MTTPESRDSGTNEVAKTTRRVSSALAMSALALVVSATTTGYQIYEDQRTRADLKGTAWGTLWAGATASRNAMLTAVNDCNRIPVPVMVSRAETPLVAVKVVVVQLEAVRLDAKLADVRTKLLNEIDMAIASGRERKPEELPDLVQTCRGAYLSSAKGFIQLRKEMVDVLKDKSLDKDDAH